MQGVADGIAVAAATTATTCLGCFSWLPLREASKGRCATLVEVAGAPLPATAFIVGGMVT